MPLFPLHKRGISGGIKMNQPHGAPRKTREMHNHHMDSTIWNDFAFRDDDIVIATYAKSGTTWLQQIVGQLVFRGDADVAVAEMSPWLDLRVPPAPVKLAAMAAQTHRRFVKTHLPVDALVWSQRAKYLYVARDGRDVVWSLYNHHSRANAMWYGAINDTPGRVGPPIGKPPADIRQYFLEWLEGDGYPFWSFWEAIRSWWAIRDQPNLKMLHFTRLKADMQGEIRAIAAFLGIAIADETMAAVLEHCSFAYMRAHGDKTVPLGGAAWEGGAETFVHKGVNGRWREVLTAEDNRRYEARARHELGEACAHWLATGEMA
jgi:aryl sulfotransferase